MRSKQTLAVVASCFRLRDAKVHANHWELDAMSGPVMGKISLRGVDHLSLICIFSSLPSMMPFGSSLASGSIRTPKSSEFAREQSHDG
ncbi:hypothetical protein DVH24_005782 [Malus domestica]|uniref:Uncharacterized protein n=1 Tax=Malus domestica TaxID=3750 RepID=A0A498IK38_MALDO|nr:hypothetical protein DVH24_005782 [Malus domestica]